MYVRGKTMTFVIRELYYIYPLSGRKAMMFLMIMLATGIDDTVVGINIIHAIHVVY